MSGVAIEVGLQLIDACQIGDTGIGTGAAFADSRDGLRQVAVRVGELNAGHGKHDQQHRQLNQRPWNTGLQLRRV